MDSTWSDAVPIWATLPASVVLLCLAVESGYRLGKWRHARQPDEKEAPVGAMVASILALLAFVLGFTFSLAASRFEARRQVVLQEANAIGTTYLRASFLPEPQRSRVRELLREYTAGRIITDDTKAGAALERANAMHQALWTQAAEAGAQAPDSIMTGLFVQSLNEVIDLHATRVLVGIRNRIPVVIWIGLISLSVLGMASVGYQAGLSATRRSPAMLCLTIAFSTVLMLIADLDRGQEGLLRVSQQALIDARQSMETALP